MPQSSQPRKLPRWREIEIEIEQRIEAGRYEDGFPGELELADEFGVSRGTMRTALRRLRESGRVVATRGRRPHITAARMTSSYGAIYSLHEVVSASGSQQQSTVLEQSLVSAPEIADELGLSSVSFFYLARVRWADEFPIALDEIWSPFDLAEPLLSVDFRDTAFYKELRDRCGVVIAGGEEELQAVTATREQAELLGCETGAALLYIVRVAHDGTRNVEFRRTHILGSRFTAKWPFPASAPGK